MRIPDLIGAAAIAGLGIFLVREGADLGLGERTEPGSGFMFWWIGVAMLVAAAALGALALAGKPAAGPEVHENGRMSLALVAIAGLVLYALALQTVGFIPTSALLLAGLFFLVGGYSPPVALGLGIGGAFASWFLFAKLLSSNLPAGILANTLFGN
jgi:putative tricarboxylic transport membrane protein